MRNQGDRLVVGSGVTAEPLSLHGGGELLHQGKGSGVGAGGGGGHPGAAAKQALYTCFHAGFSAAGHRMAGHEAWMQRLPALEHRLLH